MWISQKIDKFHNPAIDGQSFFFLNRNNSLLRVVEKSYSTFTKIYIAKKKRVSMSEFMVVATGGKIFKGAREIRK